MSEQLDPIARYHLQHGEHREINEVWQVVTEHGDQINKHDTEFGQVYTRLSIAEGDTRGHAGLIAELQQQVRELRDTLEAVNQQHARQLAVMHERLERAQAGPTLLWADGKVVNISNVAFIDLEPFEDDGRIGLVWPGTNGESYDLTIYDDGAADTLRWWLRSHSIDVVAAVEAERAEIAESEAQR